MFSDINKISEKLPIASDQKAYSSDTRDEIRRHDPDQERRKKQGGNFKDAQALFGDDRTEISVESLEAFLPMLLKNYAPQPDHRKKLDGSDFEGVVDTNNPIAKAAGAYARTAHYTNPVSNLKNKVKDVKEGRAEEANNPMLSEAEIKVIYQLQKDVVSLRQKGITTLSVTRGATLLESLQDSIKVAL